MRKALINYPNEDITEYKQRCTCNIQPVVVIGASLQESFQIDLTSSVVLHSVSGIEIDLGRHFQTV